MIDEIVKKKADGEKVTDKAPPMGASRDINCVESKLNKDKGKDKAKKAEEKDNREEHRRH